MIRMGNFASMSVEELWEIYEEISTLLEAKMLAEKEMLERRLISLHPAKTDRLKARRPYPPLRPRIHHSLYEAIGRPPDCFGGKASPS